jgi:hypothetical protein
MTGGSCRVCSYTRHPVDRTITRYFQHRQGAPWGASSPLEAVITLDRATARPVDEWPTPSPLDVWVLFQLFDCMSALPPGSRYSKARTAIRSADVLQSNSEARCESVLEALAFVGVLANAEHPGLFTRFTTAVERDQRPNTRVEVPAPLAWWSSDDGVNSEMVEELFGHLARPEVRPDVTVMSSDQRPQRTGSEKARTPTSARPQRGLRREVLAGDVYAVRFREDLWGAIFCHEAVVNRQGTVLARVEFLDVVSQLVLHNHSLTNQSLTNISFRDRENGERWQGWCRGLTKTPWVKLIAEGFQAPRHQQPTPDRIPFASASELKHLATWHFPDQHSETK